jgi:hypothetical protein
MDGEAGKVWEHLTSPHHRQPNDPLAESIPAAGVRRVTGDMGISEQGDSFALDVVISDHVTCKKGTSNYNVQVACCSSYSPSHPIVSYQLFQPKFGGATSVIIHIV